MALNTNPFIEGINPTATFGGYASVLLQLIRQAIPSSTYGMVLFDTTAPDVTGSNAWRKTCVWLNLTNPNIPTVNVYKEGTSPGWVNTNVIIADNSISTSMIKNYDPATLNTGVTLPKLSPAGGTALQLIRVNATATNFEFVSLASLVTVGSILPSAISGIAVSPGTFRVLANLNGGTTTWYHPDQVVQGVSNAVIDIEQIAPSPITSARSRFITTRTADATATWRYFDANVDILAAAMNGNRLTDFTVSVSKISPGAATEGSLLSIVGGVPDWTPANTVAGIVASKQVVQITPLPASNTPVNVITYAATGGRADIYQFYLVCITADHNHQPGDELPLASVGNDDASNEAGPLIIFDASASTVVHRGPANYQIQDATAATIQSITTAPERARWALKCVAIRFA
jgi:hypothetical protein